MHFIYFCFVLLIFWNMIFASVWFFPSWIVGNNKEPTKKTKNNWWKWKKKQQQQWLILAYFVVSFSIEWRSLHELIFFFLVSTFSTLSILFHVNAISSYNNSHNIPNTQWTLFAVFQLIFFGWRKKNKCWANFKFFDSTKHLNVYFLHDIAIDNFEQ